MSDAAAFTLLFQEHYDDLTRFVRRRADPPEVEDIVEETFLAAWRRFASLPVEVRPWLFATARNVMLNAARSRQRREALGVKVGTGTDPVADGGHADADHRMDLARALLTLTDAEQEVLALHLWDELGAAEAAVVLGCSRTAYSMRLARAKRRLAALLRPTTARPTPITD
jgi:RNA polymerase sigma-70 factor (ECF subfamily)